IVQSRIAQSRIVHSRIAQSRIVHSRNNGDRDYQRRMDGVALPAVMILTGIVSVQFGAGLADKLFGQVPPAAVTGLRLWAAAVAMVALSGRNLVESVRDLRKRR